MMCLMRWPYAALGAFISYRLRGTVNAPHRTATPPGLGTFS